MRVAEGPDFEISYGGSVIFRECIRTSFVLILRQGCKFGPSATLSKKVRKNLRNQGENLKSQKSEITIMKST